MLIPSGLFLRPRGIKGEILIKLFRGDLVSPIEGEKVFVFINDEEKEFIVERFFEYKNGSVLKMKEMNSIEEVEKLKGVKFFLEREEKIEGYIGEEIVGFKLIDRKRGEIGVVLDVIPFNPYFMIVTEFNGKEIEIPYVDGYRFEILEGEKKIFLELPEGYPVVDDED